MTTSKEPRYTLAEATRILATRAGAVKSQRKAETSRANGKLGGRPKKVKPETKGA